MRSGDPSTESLHGRFVAISLATLGVVYGDIGTSPLYAMRECFHGTHRVAVTRENVLGVLSLIFWALTIVISIKYIFYVMRADNRGEGGILALTALATSKGQTGKTRTATILLGLFGAALIYGDGMITPAISVLSAVEGLEVAAPSLDYFVQPITIAILVGLFLFQRRGTGSVGAVFGPVVLVWFSALAALGLRQIVENPDVVTAFNPVHGATFLLNNGATGFLVLGAVFLSVTGGEALYTDMGHFGLRPIRFTWFAVVFPALLLNYLGQGALLLSNPEAASNPFYRMAPEWAVYPLIVLSTFATIIASQAVISGAFSLTRQAMMLGYWPRVQIRHTSAATIGQIYVPSINWMLMIATIGLVVGFGSSSNLAAAYGIAVTTTMVIETLMAFVVARRLWAWKLPFALAVTAAFLMFDLSFFGANIIKVEHGGWFPIVVAAMVLTLMTTWKQGRTLLGERIREQLLPLDDFFEILRIERPARVPGAAVFMTSHAEGTPPALMHNFQHNRVVHQHVLLLTVVTEEVPHVHAAERLTMEKLPEGFIRLVARYGFMETPDVPELLARDLREMATTPPLDYTTFFLGRETLLPEGLGMPRWREHLFVFLSANAQRATAFFNVPPDRVMEVGLQIKL